MLENINYALFALLNATPASPQWAIEMAIFIAKDLILIVPLLVVTLWLWGPAQRQMVFKLMLALTISLTVSWAIGHLYPHDRPFVAGVGYNFLHHAADDSFPSDRVDRMQGLRITDEAAVRNERIATFDAATYTSRTFSMFGGETTPATLLVEESVMSAIIDRFGKDVESAPVDATHARVHVTVAASPVFFGWLAQFGTAVRLEAPSALARQYADYLRDIADSY